MSDSGAIYGRVGADNGAVAEVLLGGQLELALILSRLSPTSVRVAPADSSAARVRVVGADQLVTVWRAEEGEGEGEAAADGAGSSDAAAPPLHLSPAELAGTVRRARLLIDQSSDEAGPWFLHSCARALERHWQALAAHQSREHATTHSGKVRDVLPLPPPPRSRRRQNGYPRSPQPFQGTAADRTTMRVVAALLLASDRARFKRVPSENGGWRALPPATVRTRMAASFCERVRDIRRRRRERGEEVPQRDAAAIDAPWKPEHFTVLGALEMIAADASEASPASPAQRRRHQRRPVRAASSSDGHARDLAEAALRELCGGDDGGAHTPPPRAASDLLVEVGHWTPTSTSTSASIAFNDQVLEAARELRASLLAERAQLQPDTGDAAVLCIDAANARFLDDALSVEVDAAGATTLHVHITDLGSRLPPDHPVDAAARARAQSLYLPGRPLHLLPPALAEAASFSTALPTPAVTVSMQFSAGTGALRQSTVRRSVVPPVLRISYDELDQALHTRLSQLPRSDPLAGVRAALRLPGVRQRMNERFVARRKRAGGHGGSAADRRVADVRQRRDGSLDVHEFALSAGHCFFDAVLLAAGEALGAFAKRSRIAVPRLSGDGGKAGQTYRPLRFGTAPLRRYLDLLALRQVALHLAARDGRRDVAAPAFPPLSGEQVARRTVEVRRRVQRGRAAVSESRRAAVFDVLAQRHAQALAAAGGARERGLVVHGTVTAVSARGERADVLLDGDVPARMDLRAAGEAEHISVPAAATALSAGERVAVRIVAIRRRELAADVVWLRTL